jgi:hypothetical protein
MHLPVQWGIKNTCIYTTTNLSTYYHYTDKWMERLKEGTVEMLPTWREHWCSYAKTLFPVGLHFLSPVVLAESVSLSCSFHWNKWYLAGVSWWFTLLLQACLRIMLSWKRLEILQVYVFIQSYFSGLHILTHTIIFCSTCNIQVTNMLLPMLHIMRTENL